MAISETYGEIIYEKIIKDILIEGSSPTVSVINTEYDSFITDNDITKPLFISKNYKVTSGDCSSASLYNTGNSLILQDLRVLYRHLFKISDRIIETFDRWRNETKILDSRLNSLESRITSLLLISEDIEGYFNFVQDDFVDASKTDMSETTAYLNVDKNVVSIGTNSIGATKIDLDSLAERNLEFAVLSQRYISSVVSADQSKLINAIRDATNFWQEKVYTIRPTPISIELKVKFGTTQTISRIDVDLHASNSNSLMQITPMYSIDNYNYKQLPIANFTREVSDKTTFQFSPVSASEVKFIITKKGYDQVQNKQYVYEFGVDELSFYNEGFPTSAMTTSSGVIFMSKALSVLDTNKVPENFSKVTLEACEDVPEGSSVDYYVAVSNTASFDPDTATFAEISPITRSNPTKPTVLNFGDLAEVEIDGVSISYDASESNIKFINPDKEYTIIDSISGTTAVTQAAVASDRRYDFLNSEDRVLDHVINSGIVLGQGTLEIWRNVNTQGSNTKIRGYANGWGFDGTYYKTTVYVKNANGVKIDWGGEKVTIDGISKTGNVTLSKGNHIIRVHKDNWKEVDFSSVTTLAEVKDADDLYPYNHRYLVEGISYPSDYSTTDEQLYRGFDTVAEYLMKKVSPFDLVYNVPSTDYEKFAIDTDSADSSGTIDGVVASKASMNTFLLKVNTNNADFVNEDFLIKFKSVNTEYKYLRLKAILKTTDSSITPVIDNYRIKIGS